MSPWPWPSALQQRAADAAPIELRVGFARPGGGYTVQTLPLETYIARVLAGEAARESPPAALEALAITIRTFALGNPDRHRADGFDLCDETHCQVVRTATAGDTTSAAQATAGQVLMRNGAIAPVFYSASCGGRTEIPSNVWPGADDPPHLPSADDEACEGAPAWEAELRPADLLRAFHAAGFRGNQLRDMRIVSRNSSGRVARLRLDGLTPAEISGQDLRVVVGRTLGWQHIKSTTFELRLAGERVPIRRPRVWPRRRPVRHRLDQPRRARDERDRHPSEVLSRGRHRGCRVARASAPPSGVLVSLPDDDEGEERAVMRGSPPWPATSSRRRSALPRRRG